MSKNYTLPAPVENAGAFYPQASVYTENEILSRFLLKRRTIRRGELFIEKGIAAISFLSLAFIVLIFLFVFKEASPIFFKKQITSELMEHEKDEMETYGEEYLTDPITDEIEMYESKEPQSRLTILKKIFGTKWNPVSLEPMYGLLPLLAGSFKVSLIAVLISAPLGILAALYSAVFAPKWVKEIVKPGIEILAGFPSVVIGFFVLEIFASVLQHIMGFQYRLNAFTGGVALSLALIPVIYTLSEDALVTVPRSFVEASLALGAYKWETALYVVLPAAIPGIFAAVLLGVGRAIGETMIVLMVTGNAALLSMNMFEPVRTMSAAVGAEMAEVVYGDTHYSVLFLLGIILLATSFVLNMAVEFFIRQKLMKRFKGA